MVIEKKLIELVRVNESLYNLKHKNYRRKDIKEEIWSEIAVKMCLPVQSCKNKWKHLRDRYRKINKNRKDTPSGSGANAVEASNWKFFEMLSFLNKAEDQREKNSIVPPPSIEQRIISPQNDISDREDEVNEEVVIESADPLHAYDCSIDYATLLSTAESTASPLNNHMKIETTLNFLYETIATINNELNNLDKEDTMPDENDNEHTMFIKNAVSLMMPLSKALKDEVRRKIFDLIMTARKSLY